ncbi:ATP-dependent DNA ligase [Tessaracoccus flavus]|uniref:DNA ligase (ATP) n=1 Tax=Tessaracoccus flavus TaxID=1610493 RepID=A0A1Q2CE89_9ACTN|nr:ATP-dependent DNA ligase [Tessaracoccus flavus]AQP44390.1 ATP-dependent DNA ligase [Tessaracoccus flavus]SDY67988.1 DNA ligase-1 [Tessaracoccus flavus]
MQLKTLVDAVAEVASTRSRTAKIELLASFLRQVEPEDLRTAIGLLVGKPPQGRLGVGARGLQAHRQRAADRPTLGLGDVGEAFDTLAEASGPGSTAVRASTLAGLMASATRSEQDHLARVILGDVRSGALEGILTDAVAAAAGQPKELVRRAAMLTGDLAETARRAMAGDDLQRIGLTPGVPVLPMLASTAATAAEAIAATGRSSVEHKLDGARLQVHRTGDEVWAYTRSLADITARVPEVVATVAAFPGGDLILDGETLTLDEDGSARPFQESMSRLSSHGGEGSLAVWFFDVLHAEGRTLIDEPLETRRAVLARIVGDRLIRGAETSVPGEAQRVLDDALAAGQEGIVVKSLDAPYAAGRRGNNWVKVKPVYTYDLVVLGIEWGSGRRAGTLSNIHLGARDPEGRFGEPGGFVMVGKTFKGMTDEILRWQTEHFAALETGRTEWGITVAPTTVVEIAIDGVQRSSRYPGGVALRFARVKRYRTGADEKAPAEADTIDTLRALLR